jgi:hypothetical protein
MGNILNSILLSGWVASFFSMPAHTLAEVMVGRDAALIGRDSDGHARREVAPRPGRGG